MGPRLADGLPRGADPRGRRLGALRDRRLVAHRRPHRARTRSRPSTTRASTAARSCAPAQVASTRSAARTTGSAGTSTAPSARSRRRGTSPMSTRRRSACPRHRSGHGAGSSSSTSTRRRRHSRTTSRTSRRTSPSGPSRSATSPPTSSATMPCNWKVALEAFIEAYHTLAVHPQLLTTAADSLTEYDVYGPHVSRMITAVGVSSEHLDRQLDDVEIVRAMLGSKDAEVVVEPGSSARQVLGERIRASLRKRTGRDYSNVTDAELLDGIEYFLFPNFMPWAGFLTSFAYRFRPDGHDPDSCVIDIMVLEPIPDGADRPPAAADPGARPGRDVGRRARARCLRAGVQPGRLDVRAGAARTAGLRAAHDDAGPLPGEPDPALPRDPRPLPRRAPADGRSLHARASGAARLGGPDRRSVRPARGRGSSTTSSEPPSSTPPSKPPGGASCAPTTSSGSPWASGVEVAIVAEELARGLADAPFPGPTLAAELRRAAGLPFDGVRETVAMRPDLSGLAAPNEARRRHRRRVRRSRHCVLGQHGTVVSVPVSGATAAVDLTRPTAALEPAEGVVLGTVPPDAIDRWTALALTATAADLVGAMRGAIDLTCAYATDRRQFGRPVGSFQAVQHLLADAVVHLEGSTCFAVACGVGRRRDGRRGRPRRCRLRQGVRLPGRESGARDRHPGPRRHRQHVGVHGARLPAPVTCCPSTCAAESVATSSACSCTRSCREVLDGLPRLARGGGVPGAVARLAGGQQPAPSAVIDFR